jgi:gliding motility-associated-like protein
MKHLYKAHYKLWCLFLVACFCFNAVYAQPPIPADQNFSFFGSNSANGQTSRITNFGGINYTVATPTAPTTGTHYSFFGNGGPSAGTGGPFRNLNPSFIFNYNVSGGNAYMPYATQTPGGGGCDYRISFSQTTPGVDTTKKSGNFWIKSMYLAIGTGNTATIVIQGFRAGKIVAEATITNLSTSDPTDIASSGTDLNYSGGSDAFSGITIQFGTNWNFLDGLRFLIPSGDIPLEIDDLDFDDALAIAPATQATSMTSINITGISANINWSPTGAADYNTVFIKATNTGDAAPAINTDYTANTSFGSGSQIGSTGWYCIYDGKGSSTNVSGLTPGTVYGVMAIAYNGNTLTKIYNTASGSNFASFPTIAIPATQASAVAVTNITGTTASLSWTLGTGTMRAVFVSLTNTGTASPVFNTNYSASTNVTSGSQIGSTGWRCVYNGTGSTVDIVNLVPGQTYRVMVTEYNDNGLGPNYNTYNINAATGNPVNFTMDNVPVVSSSAASSITSIGAIINGSINDMGANTTVSFQYGTSPSLSSPSTVAGSPLTVTAGDGLTTVSSVLSGLTPSTTYYFRARGVNAVGATNGSSILSFITAPVITDVTSLNGNGSYKAGMGMNFRVTFSSAVFVTGTPQLALNSGGIAHYVSGSGTTILTFNYTVGAGETASDLDYTSISALTLSGGTIKDAATTDANITLPAPGAAGSLGANKNIIIDTQIPSLSTVTIVSDNANTALAKTGNIITFSFTSSETINTPTVTVAGNAATVTNTGGNNRTATYTMAGTEPTGAVAFNISFSDIANNAGVAVTATTNSSNVNYDKTDPTLSTVVIASNNANTALAKTGDVITINFTSSETLLSASATIAGNTATVSNVSGNNWKAVYTMVAGDASGVIPFSISFSDLAGNAATAVTATTNSSSVNYDKTDPILSSVVIASNNANTALAKAGDVITINFTSGETLLTASGTIAGNAATVSNVSGNNWKAVYTMAAGDAGGVMPFSISFSDLAGNAGTAVTATTNSSSVNYDRTDPTLTSVVIASNNVNTALAKAGDVITINFTSGETLLTASVTIAGNAATVSNVSGNNWKAVYTMAAGDAGGVIPFSISFSDLVGNAGTVVTATTNGTTVNYDKTDPTLTSVVIASNNVNTALAKAGDVITINFTSGETLLAASATIAGNTATVSNVSGNNWKAVYTMTVGDASGVIPFAISYTDIAGNGGVAVSTTNGSSVSYDKTSPILSTVVIASNNANAAYAKTGDVITLNFTANESLTTPIVTIAGHAIIAINTSGNSYAASNTMVSGDASGTVPFSISFGDIAGNAGSTVIATTNSSSVTFDKIVPTVTSVSRLVPLTQDFSGAGSVTYRVNFSEAVKNVTVAAFQLTQLSGSISATIASVSASTGSAIDVMINNFTGSGSFRMDLKSSGTGITDNAGNNISGGFTGGQLYGNNTSPIITAGAVQSIAICQGLTTATSINNLLAATDVDNGQTLTWTVQSGPSHGTLSGFPATATVVNGSLVPSGLTYIADATYSGADAFVIQVSDGSLSVTTTVNVTVNPLPAVTLTSSQGTILCGTAATLNIDAPAGNTYVWHKNGTAISSVSAAQLNVNSIGVYTATATNAAGCVANATNSITITQLQKPTVDFSFDSYCTNKPVSFTNLSVTNNSGPVTYAWTDGNGNTSTSAAPVFTYTQVGSYTVKLKITPTNCPAIVDSISKIVQVEAPAAATRLTTQNIAANKSVQLTARTLPATYTWVPANGLSANNIANPFVSVSGEVQYTIAMKVASGCITTDTLLVRVFGQNDIYVPNVFTPNGDGVNDKLLVNLVGVKNFHYFRVFNRQGKMIFETMNQFEGWDGKVNGVLQPMDTYVWVAQGTDQNGAIIHKQGATTIIR